MDTKGRPGTISSIDSVQLRQQPRERIMFLTPRIPYRSFEAFHQRTPGLTVLPASSSVWTHFGLSPSSLHPVVSCFADGRRSRCEEGECVSRVFTRGTQCLPQACEGQAPRRTRATSHREGAPVETTAVHLSCHLSRGLPFSLQKRQQPHHHRQQRWWQAGLW